MPDALTSRAAQPYLGPRLFTAPGRVNLLGEHTDYTGGSVLPMAIPFETRVSVQPRAEAGYSFSSAQFPTSRILASGETPKPAHDWSDYPVGVLHELQQLDITPPPFALQVTGDVPLNAGLSSSASIEVATAVALLAHAEKQLSPEQIALLCQRAENNFVGSPCGIMDQFVITAATESHALLLNTRDLRYELLPMQSGALAGCCIIVVNSAVKHSIAGGDYGIRRREVEEGQTAIRSAFPEAHDLGAATLDQLAACEGRMSPEAFRRCRHIISENGRVAEARSAMLAGDPVALGHLMNGSHTSQRDDFQCSVAEIDFLVETATALDGCFGARLTGGGFGGCTVNLVRNEAAERFREAIVNAYQTRYNIHAETYLCTAADGAVARLQHPGDRA